jgi:hypothetical protein
MGLKICNISNKINCDISPGGLSFSNGHENLHYIIFIHTEENIFSIGEVYNDGTSYKFLSKKKQVTNVHNPYIPTMATNLNS